MCSKLGMPKEILRTYRIKLFRPSVTALVTLVSTKLRIKSPQFSKVVNSKITLFRLNCQRTTFVTGYLPIAPNFNVKKKGRASEKSKKSVYSNKY